MTHARFREASRRTGRVVVSTLLTVGAVLGCACVALGVAAPLWDLRPLVFLSGSMSPTIPAGSLALARETPASGLRVGDVVTVPTGGTYVTHRVIAIDPVHDAAPEQGPDQVLLRLRGDANAEADRATYAVSSAPRTLVSVPYAGSVVAFVSTPPGVFLLAGYVMFLVSVLRRGVRVPRGGGGGTRAGPPRRRASRLSPPRRRVTRLAAVVTPLSLVVTALTAAPARAGFTDGVTVSGATLSAGAMVAPSLTCSGGGLLTSPTIDWSTPAGPVPTSYLVTYVRGGTTSTDTTTATEWQLPGSALSLLATYTITVQSVRHDWRSAPSNAVQVSITNVLFLGLVSACV